MVVTTIGEGKAVLEEEEKRKLNNILAVPRVGVIVGGGKGVPGKDVFTPLMKALEGPLYQGTPMAGICLWFQTFAKMVSAKELGEEEKWRLVQHYWEIGSQVEKLTSLGKLHPVFMQLGDVFVAVASNTWQVAFPEGLQDTFEFGQVLARGSMEQPTGVSFKFEKSGQVVGIQRHPEWQMKGSEKAVMVSLAGDGEIELPAGLSQDMVHLIGHVIAPSFSKWREDYGLTPEDVGDLVSPERLPRGIGNEFYGWLLNFFAEFRQSTYERKS